MELRKYWEIILRRKSILIQAMLIVPISAYIFVLILSPVYQSTAKLLIKVNSFQQQFIDNMPGLLGTLSFADPNSVMGSIEEIVESASVVRMVISEMELQDNNGKLFKEKDVIDPGRFKLILQKKGVGIELIPDSEVIKVTGYSDKLSEAQEIAEKTIMAFFAHFSDIYKKDIRNVIEVIKNRIQTVKIELTEAEDAVENFKKTHSLYESEIQIPNLLSKIAHLNEVLWETERVLYKNKNSLNPIKDALSKHPEYLEGKTTLEKNRLLENYKNKLMNLKMDLSKRSQELTPEHPEIKSILNQIEVIKSLIKEAVKKSLLYEETGRNEYYDSLISRYSNTEIEIANNYSAKKVLSRQIAQAEKKLEEFSEKEKELNRLLRKLDIVNKVYRSLSSSLETALSASKLELTNAVVVQLPSLSADATRNLYFPPENKMGLLAKTTLLAFFFGLFLIFFVEYLDGTIKNAHHFEAIMKQKVVGKISKAPKIEWNLAALEQFSLIADSYDLLTNIKLFESGAFPKKISVMSHEKGNGKSTVASLLAIALAQQGHKTLIIEGNLRGPSFHKIFFNLPNTKGISDFLLGHAETQEIIADTSVNNLYVISAGSVSIAAPQKYFNSTRFFELVTSLSAAYDFVIVDTPAFVSGRDALLLSYFVKNTLLVVEQNRTSVEQAKEFIGAITNANIRPVGIVLNKVARHQKAFLERLKKLHILQKRRCDFNKRC